MHRLSFIGTLFVVALAVPPSVAAQQTPAPNKAAAKLRAKKVWTDDDVRQLRTAADEYAGQKQGPEQAAGSGSTPEKARPAARDPFFPPKTLEEAQVRTAQKREEISGQQELIRRAREEYFNETNDGTRDALRKRIDQLTSDLKEAETHLKLLERSLAELKLKTEPQSPPQAGSDSQAPSPAQPPL